MGRPLTIDSARYSYNIVILVVTYLVPIFTMAILYYKVSHQRRRRSAHLKAANETVTDIRLHTFARTN